MSLEKPQNFAGDEAPKRSLNSAETLSFLSENNVKPLGEWKQGSPVLYVLEEFYRGDDGHYMMFPPHLRPSIVRLDAPDAIDLDNPHTETEIPGLIGRVSYKLVNKGGRVDYFAIDQTTKKPILVKTSHRDNEATDFAYNVTKEGLFETNDRIFPKNEVAKS